MTWISSQTQVRSAKGRTTAYRRTRRSFDAFMLNAGVVTVAVSVVSRCWKLVRVAGSSGEEEEGEGLNGRAAIDKTMPLLREAMDRRDEELGGVRQASTSQGGGRGGGFAVCFGSGAKQRPDPEHPVGQQLCTHALIGRVPVAELAQVDRGCSTPRCLVASSLCLRGTLNYLRHPSVQFPGPGTNQLRRRLQAERGA